MFCLRWKHNFVVRDNILLPMPVQQQQNSHYKPSALTRKRDAWSFHENGDDLLSEYGPVYGSESAIPHHSVWDAKLLKAIYLFLTTFCFVFSAGYKVTNTLGGKKIIYICCCHSLIDIGLKYLHKFSCVLSESLVVDWNCHTWSPCSLTECWTLWLMARLAGRLLVSEQYNYIRALFHHIKQN